MLHDKIKLFKKDERCEGKTNVELLQDFLDFLQGKNDNGIVSPRGHRPKMSHKKAFSIIYYLQEVLPVFPETIEMCSNCNDLYDSDSEGIFWESKGKHYCGGCENLVPLNYDNCQRR